MSYLEKLKLKKDRTCIQTLFFLFMFASCYGQSDHKVMVILHNTITDSVPFCPYAVALLPLKSSNPDFNQDYHLTHCEEMAFPLQIIDYRIPESERKAGKQIKVLKGMKNDTPVIIIDADDDGNFGNNKPILLNSQLPFFKIQHALYFNGTNYIQRPFFVKPYNSSLTMKVNGKIRTVHSLGMLVMPTYKYGEGKIGDSTYKFALNNYSLNKSGYGNKLSRLVIASKKKSFLPCIQRPIEYKLGDTLYVGNKILVFSSISHNGDSLSFIEIGTQNRLSGYLPGYFAFNFNGSDILTGKALEINNDHSYVLLDFWGTWCPPCIESTGALKQLTKQFKGKPFKIIGIAYDKSKDTVADYLKENKVKWVNLFDSQTKGYLTQRFKVQAFPTYILLDPDGKIIKRGSGKEYLSKVRSYLISKFK